jgi:EAL domain-containing protein (putative c-di-GMP-specific phosphodiesterase class I)
MGCHEGQGYLYAKPMVSPLLIEWIRARKTAT